MLQDLKGGGVGFAGPPDPSIYVGGVFSIHRPFEIIAQALFEAIWHSQSLLEQINDHSCILQKPLELILLRIEHCVGLSFCDFSGTTFVSSSKHTFQGGKCFCAKKQHLTVGSVCVFFKTQIPKLEIFVLSSKHTCRSWTYSFPARNQQIQGKFLSNLNFKVEDMLFPPNPHFQVGNVCLPHKPKCQR